MVFVELELELGLEDAAGELVDDFLQRRVVTPAGDERFVGLVADRPDHHAERARSIDEGFINVARLLGASEWQITRTVVIPSTMAWVFASLSPAISFALIGVIVGEFIGAERGIGRLIIESEARGEASGMMVAVIVLMLVGVVLSALIRRLQAYLLRWQQHNMAE